MEQTALQRRIRVAAYRRTAVNSDDQINGVAAQKAYYTQKISENPDWEMVGIFADAGITSAGRKRRVELNRLVAACRRGEVDMIITKSVSRFARDIRDCVGQIQELKAVGVGVIFEKKDINTFGGSDDIHLTILSALARIESENITPNLIFPARQMDKSPMI